MNFEQTSKTICDVGSGGFLQSRNFVNFSELKLALNAARDRSVELSEVLEEEKNRSAYLDVSLEAEKEKNNESAKTEKIVAQQLKGALDAVQVNECQVLLYC